MKLSGVIHIIEYYSGIKKKNEILPFVTTWLDLEGMLLSEISQTKTNIVVTRQEQTHRHKEQTGGCQRGGRWGREEGERD